jgi:hypothetical protein
MVVGLSCACNCASSVGLGIIGKIMTSDARRGLYMWFMVRLQGGRKVLYMCFARRMLGLQQRRRPALTSSLLQGNE